jgi:nicotinamidase-related amidase
MTMTKVTALLIVDPQRIYTDKKSEMYCADSSETLARINRLLKVASQQGWLVITVRHVHKADGTDLGRMFDFAGDDSGEFNFRAGTDEVKYDSRLKIQKGTTEVLKNRYSAFAGTKLDDILKKKNVSRIVITGFMTNFCCESTARDAHDRDYYVDFITDATGTPGTEGINEQQMRAFVAECLAGGIARVFSTEDYIQSVST